MEKMTKLLLFCVVGFLVKIVAGSRPPDAIVVFTEGEGGYYCQKIPYLYRTLSGTLLAFAEGRGKDGRANCDDFAGTDLIWKRSLDDGKTWSTLATVYSNSSLEETNVIGNAAPVQDRDTGRIWLPFCRNNEEVFISHSDDDGVSWSPPVYYPQLVLSDWKWVGLGPPGGIQLQSGRLLIPSYHTDKWKGDGCASRGHIIYSDDHGQTWSIGSEDFGRPYFANECQAVELKNGSVLINARTITNQRVQVVSNDGGLTFGDAYVPDLLIQPLEGCEGSLVRDSTKDILYFSDPFTRSPVRTNMTIFKSIDEGLTWDFFVQVDEGSVAYSSMQINEKTRELGLLYERSETTELVFEPDEIVYWKISIA